MTVKRLVAVAFAFGLGILLGSCSSFSDAVSDHWPHFAGGEPDGLPPRPGTPGYDSFIAHGQAAQGAAGNAQPAAAGQGAAANPNDAGAGQSPSAYTEPRPQAQQPGAQLPPPAAHSGSDPAGLY